MRCWECKKKVKSARTVLYIVLNSYNEPVCEKERNVCDSCYHSLPLQDDGTVYVKEIEQRITREIAEWARNIARNYNAGLVLDIYSDLLDACKDLGLNKNKMYERWSRGYGTDYSRTGGVYFILTGSPYWRKGKGYIWF